MAASDQTYRNQRILDIVFGVSNVLMLLSIIWMFAQDYNREYKKEQRTFRDVESAMSIRGALEKMPTKADFDAAQAQLEKARANLPTDEIKELENKISQELSAKVDAEHKYQAKKADFDSYNSLYDIAVDQHGKNSAKAVDLLKKIEDQKKKMDDALGKYDDLNNRIKDYQRQKAEKEKGVTEALAQLKRLNDTFDIQAKNAILKRWGLGDWFRDLPVLDAFASPTRIQQITLNDLPIDYSFKHVTRYDRCTSCHLGIDRPAYTREKLLALGETTEKQEKDLEDAVERLKERKAALKGLPEADNLPDPAQLRLTTVKLTPGRVNEFCAHPRLDLFVAADSPHPVEKFGCTSCHAGQGSATSFGYAAHTPNDAETAKDWKKYGWTPSHFWDFPMLPQRFIESSCLKCHYEVTDLMKEAGKVEYRMVPDEKGTLVRKEVPGPGAKVLRGYNLIRENGCFGCHEISGLKTIKGDVTQPRRIGPDMRLEPNPPLDALTPQERAQATADPSNPPGTLRKIGPNLYRLSEKTNTEFVKKWLKAPREFRPDTKMPHYYGLSNNRPEVLPPEQKAFPDAEIDGIAYYLFSESKKYLQGKDTFRELDEERMKELSKKIKDLKDRKLPADQEEKELYALKRRLELTTKPQTVPEFAPDNIGEWFKAIHGAKPETLVQKFAPIAAALDEYQLGVLHQKQKAKQNLSDGEKKLLAEIEARQKQRGTALKEEDKEKLTLATIEKYDATPERLVNGRRLFSERGCLACHMHRSTLTDDDQHKLPALPSDAAFAPNLSQLVAKLGAESQPGDKTLKRMWLMQWVMEPTFHHPRTYMPVTHLTADQAADVATWLLSQEAQELGANWNNLKVADSSPDTFWELAKVYLERIMSRSELEALRQKKLGKDRIDSLPLDEKLLAQDYNPKDPEKLKWYVGRKAIGRLGCFGCHEVPGFDQAKPIGTPLNDWGKKDAERLAFEDIITYLKEHHSWEGHENPNGTPYDSFFAEALLHKTREGYLHQKLLEPRSYDFNRLRAWDDRSRMPKFSFARTRLAQGEKSVSDPKFKNRQLKAENEAREAVMTFVLGLVAEPIPFKFVNTPPPERLAEVKGLQVLERFNCVGCHQIQSGSYEFNKTNDVVNKLANSLKDDPSDIAFLNHNAWSGRKAPSPDRLVAYGAYRPGAKKIIALAEALHFENGKPDLRAFTQIPYIEKEMVFQAHPYGGTFTDLLWPYLNNLYDLNRDNRQLRDELDGVKDEAGARVASPPSLFREGEKVQPSWLFQFLRNPHEIRPRTVLRMPRFNLSEDDAKALVDYFAGVEKLTNPGIKLTSPYVEIPQRDKEFWTKKSAEYVKRLKNQFVDEGKKKTAYVDRLEKLTDVWKRIAHEERQSDLKKAEQSVKSAEGELAKAKQEDEKTFAKKQLEEAKEALKTAEKRFKQLEGPVTYKDFPELVTKWETEEAYAADAFRIVVNPNLGPPCATCHQVAQFTASNPRTGQGPSLNLTYQRLRPEWVKRWIANPQRYTPYYTSVMPNNFNADKLQWHAPFAVSGKSALDGSLEQVGAARDLLMNLLELADLPINRYYTPTVGKQ
jgi:mono/diheme cytochrome c family protein